MESFLLMAFIVNLFAFMFQIAMVDNVLGGRIKVKHIIIAIMFPLATLLIFIILGIIFLIISFSESNIGTKILKFLNKDVIK